MEALYLNDQVMEFDLTPNRADALSMIGTAYEVAALYNTKMTKPETASNELDLSANDELTVKIENEEKYHIIVRVLFMMSQLLLHRYGCKRDL